MQLLSQDKIKEHLGKKGAEYVQDGMIVGLGTGSTSAYFIHALSERCKAGLTIKAVCSSINTRKQAEKEGIPLLDATTFTKIDLTIDGADEVDADLRLIKGGGGAHLCEKILATASRQLIILVDESKLVSKLGKGKVPVEIVPFGMSSTLDQIKALGYHGSLRTDKQDNLYITDNHNYLFDIQQPGGFIQPEKTHLELLQIPGVIDTGFFFNLAHIVLVGYQDGRIESLQRDVL